MQADHDLHERIALAGRLFTLFARTGDESSLDESIAFAREAGSLASPELGCPSLVYTTLAAALAARALRTGDVQLLNEAAFFGRETLLRTPAAHPDRWRALLDYAVPLKIRYELAAGEASLEEALELERGALALTAPGHAGRPAACAALSVSLGLHFARIGEVHLLDEAIVLGREALRGIETPYERARVQVGLGALLYSAYTRHRQEQLAEESERMLLTALESLDLGSPLRWRVHAALAKLLLDDSYSRYDLVHAVGHLTHMITTSAAPTLVLPEAAALLASIQQAAVPTEARPRILEAYSKAIDLSSQVVDLTAYGFVPNSETVYYLNISANLGLGAFLLSIHLGQYNAGLRLLEQARNMAWFPVMRQKDPQIQELPPEIAAEYEDLLYILSKGHHLYKLEPQDFDKLMRDVSLHLTPRDTLHHRHSCLKQLSHDIRLLPGHSNFGCDLSAHALLDTATHYPVVVLAPAADVCHALLIHKGSIAHISLPDINDHELKSMTLAVDLPELRGSDVPDNQRLGIRVSRQTTKTGFHQVLARLWKAVVEPIISYLRLNKAEGKARPRICWCPISTFASVPLHAAGIYESGQDVCCSDYVVSSYAPTLTALARAQGSPVAIKRSQLRLALFSATHTAVSGLPPLASVDAELDAIAATAARAGVSVVRHSASRDATAARVAERLAAAHAVHIACHGLHDAPDPLASGFCLRDGRLAVAQLMRLDLARAFLAFLSACETARAQPDLAIHLAAAMLCVGFRSVVATMWAMNDADGPFVAQRFYEKLLEEETVTADSAPYALDYAVSALRRRGASPAEWATFIHVGA